jgi:uncharacterized protein YjbJ (UPF0337 family)
MADLQIGNNWDKIKIKVKRKYRDLTDADLTYTSGNEEALINNLMKALSKDRKYVEFMLKIMLVNSDTNRL